MHHEYLADKPRPALRIRKACGEYTALARLWRRSVEASHDFLQQEDLESLYTAMPRGYLPGVAEVWLAEWGGQLAAFMGCNGQRVEMLFVEPEQRGCGLGSALLAHARQLHGPLLLDVRAFYF